MVSNKKAKQARREAELAAIRGKRGSGKPRDWFTITMSMVVVVFVLGVGGFLTWMNIQSSMYSSADASTLSAKGTVYDGFFIDDRGIKVPEGLDGTPYEFKDAVWEASPYPTEIGNTIDLYVDSSCPHCYNFWQQNEGQITEWLNNGTIDQLYIHPLTFLDNFSIVGSNAMACTAEYNPTYALQVYSYFETLQPKYGEGSGRSNMNTKKMGSEISGLIYKDLGIPVTEEYTTCLSSVQYSEWATSATSRAMNGPLALVGNAATKVSGTPTIFVNGVQYSGDPSPDTLNAFVQQVIAGNSSNQTVDTAEQSEVSGVATETN